MNISDIAASTRLNAAEVPPAAQTPTETFITQYTEELSREIRQSAFAVFDLETTGLTYQDTPVSMTKQARIGPSTFNQYQKAHPGCTADTTLRARIIAIQLDTGRKLALDLDALTPAERARAFTDCLDGKTLIGHNLTFDLCWSSHYTSARPARILDTMLLVRTVRPDLPLMLHVRAAAGNQDARDIVFGIQKGMAGVSLEHVSVALGYPRPDKTYQKPANWAVSHLTQEHYDYVMSDVHLPLEILARLTGKDSVSESIEVIDSTTPIYAGVFEPAILALVRAHNAGMPLHLPTLSAMKSRMMDEIASASTALLVEPEFQAHAASIQGASLSMPESLKQAWSAYAERHGVTLPRTDKGGISMDANAVKLAGLTDTPAWTHWEVLQGMKKRIGMLCEYEDVSVYDVLYYKNEDGAPCRTDSWKRLRPLIGINAATLRTSSQVPNVQNLPRSGGFRDIIRARPGRAILSIDYSQIELRIAAALSLRAIGQVKDPRYEVKRWVREAIQEAEAGLITRECPPRPVFGKSEASEWSDFYGWELAHWYRKVLDRGTPLAEVFRHNLDPHLLTAVGMAARAGKVDLGGMLPTEFLRSHPDPGALKALLKEERQGAKAQNFGLLYGMSGEKLHSYGITQYGLSWTEEEALAAKDAWLDLYPEIRFWQLWTRHTSKVARKSMLVRNQYSNKVAVEERQIWRVYTLSGRPIVVTSLLEALNYQDQGTGADMALDAAGHLDDTAAPYFIDIIHDELLFEVPNEQVEAVTASVRSTMLSSASKLLAPFNIPADCEASVAETWQH